ncbi:STAS domain-containing protein [Streptomyces sp. H27-S2]|uniref:STAS domain-containing protein n=1 Tax=Streptomyces antarcticus TaxID=2996458 RepID=UPI00226F8296|nr:STAS domain-containing protein [Streptomyces sp. H27-S2]MCY0954067.1 STAS domain-containing protein [Streptomyces sp. H27-S2]
MAPAVHLTCHHTDGPLALAAVTGDIDFDTAPSLRDRALNLLAQGHHHLILDVADVSFCDSSGLNALIGIMRCAQEQGGTLSLAAVPDRLLHLLQMTGLDTVLPTHPTATEALTAHQAQQHNPATA